MSDGLDAIYSQQAVTATYTPASGSAKSVSVLVDDRTKDRQDKSGGRMLVERLVGSVRVSEVSSLGQGDTFTLGGETTVFKVVPSSVTNDGLEFDFEAVSETPLQFGDVARMPMR